MDFYFKTLHLHIFKFTRKVCSKYIIKKNYENQYPR